MASKLQKVGHELSKVTDGYCKECGEYIPVAIPRDVEGGSLVFICADCYDERPVGGCGHTDRAAITDMNYHGGRFMSGEW